MYEDWNEDYLEEEEEYPISRAAKRRKNDWKFANRRRGMEKDKVRPLHYYSKNAPESRVDRRQMRRKQRQIEDFENQMDELFD